MAESRYQKILVPLDGSGRSQRAVTHAVDLARTNGGEIILVHVFRTASNEYVDSITLGGGGEAYQQARQQMKQYLIGVRTELRNEDVRVRTHMIEGAAVAHLLCDYVRGEGIDLIVMCTRGHTGLARMLFGSTAREIMECVEVPVLLVQPDKE